MSTSNIISRSLFDIISRSLFVDLVFVLDFWLPNETVYADRAQAGIKKFICDAKSHRSLYMSILVEFSLSYKSSKSAGAPDLSLIRWTLLLSRKFLEWNTYNQHTHNLNDYISFRGKFICTAIQDIFNIFIIRSQKINKSWNSSETQRWHSNR